MNNNFNLYEILIGNYFISFFDKEYLSYEVFELLHYSIKDILEYAFENVTITYDIIKYDIFGMLVIRNSFQFFFTNL